MGALTANRHTRNRTGSNVEYPVLASAHIYAGSLVCLNANGWAVPGADTSGLVFAGVALAEADNTGKANGATKILVKTDGLHLFAASGLAQTDVGITVHVSDDQTVKTAVGNGVICGQIVQVESATLCWVNIHCALVVGSTIAASAVSITDPTSIITGTNVETALAEIMVGMKTAQYSLNPVTWTLETGAPTIIFADGAGATSGWTQLTNKENAYRWNNHATPNKIALQFIIPPDLNPLADMVVHYLGVIIRAGGAVDSPVLTVEAYFSMLGSDPLADANCGAGDSGEFTALTTYQEKTSTIALADIPAVASVLTLILNPKDGELGTDDFALVGVWIEGTRACLTA